MRTAYGLSDRIKLIYVERPIVFALAVGADDSGFWADVAVTGPGRGSTQASN